MSSSKFLVFLLAVALAIGAVGSVYADSGFFNDWKAAYPSSASATFSCSLCHTSAPALNGYGQAALDANFNFTSIESQDSDGDGAANIAEITAGTNPGSTSSKPPTAACTGYTYSAWSACGSNGQQTRTVMANTPAGCTGTPSASPALTQSCTPSSTACTSFTYGNWTACDQTGHQTRTATGVPAGCTGTPDPGQLTQTCNYVPPTQPPVGETMFLLPQWSFRMSQ